jgi:hypothetical protein
MRLWGTAAPVPAHELPHDAVSLRVRASSEVASPFTIGSGILLPADRTTWDSGRLRIVLARERSHVCQGDFYLQQLACLYAALVWPNPLGCWLKHELAELAEAISDRAAMEEAASRTAYAEILFEFAAQPRRISIGVAMVRPVVCPGASNACSTTVCSASALPADAALSWLPRWRPWYCSPPPCSSA